MLNKIVRFLMTVSSVIFISLLLIIWLSISDRFMFHIGFFWTEETSRYLFIWVSLLAVPLVIQRQEHFKVDYFVKKFLKNELFKLIFDMVISIIIGGLMVIILVYGTKFAHFVKFQYSPTLRISMLYVCYAVPVSATLNIIFLVVNIYRSAVKLKYLKRT